MTSARTLRCVAKPLSVGIALLVTLGSLCPQRPLRARRITAATAAVDLFGGSDATGGIGDWVLTNGLVEAIVDDVGYQADLELATGARVPIQTLNGATGGTLVDLGSFGTNNDSLGGLIPVSEALGFSAFHALPAGEALDDPALPALIATVDAASGVASLTVHGRVVVDPGLPVLSQPVWFRQIYSVRRGERCLRLRTEVENRSPLAIELDSIGDASVLGRGGALAFVPHPERGFALTGDPILVPFVTQFGTIGPEHGPVWDGVAPVGGSSYTIAAPDEAGLLDASSDATLLAATSFSGPLAPGETRSYERRIYVGTRNDVAASAELALRDLAAARGLAVGTLRGRLEAEGGLPFQASIEITLVDLDPATPEPETLVSLSGGDPSPQPLLQIATDSASALAGSFQVELPAGRYRARIALDARDPIEGIEFEIRDGERTDLGTLLLPLAGTLHVSVSDAPSGAPLTARLTLKGITVPDPMLGAPVDLAMAGAPLAIGSRGPLPWGNLVYTSWGASDVTLRPGRYRVIATRGPEYDAFWQDVEILPGAISELDFSLTRVVDTSGWLAADFHVHAAASADSSVPPRDRLATLVAAGVEVVVSADHDFVFDYAPVIEAEGLGAQIASIAGTELSSSRSPSPFVAGVGHFNGWPLVADREARKNGAPEDERVPPSVLLDRLRAGGAEVVQLNHPLWANLGLLLVLGYDPLLPLGAPPNDYLLETSPLGTGTRNLDFDAIEIYNGIVTTQYEMARDVWLGLLGRGERITATAASDSHRVALQNAGSPRSWVAHAPDDPAALDRGAFDAAVREMRVVGSSGPFLEVELRGAAGTAGLGETLMATPGEALALHVRVQAPCWIPVGTVRVFANAVLAIEAPIDTTSCTGVVRFDDEIAVQADVDTAWFVEVVEPLPRVNTPFDKQLVTHVIGNDVIRAFANPVFADTDGNGVYDRP